MTHAHDARTDPPGTPAPPQADDLRRPRRDGADRGRRVLPLPWRDRIEPASKGGGGSRPTRPEMEADGSRGEAREGGRCGELRHPDRQGHVAAADGLAAREEAAR